MSNVIIDLLSDPQANEVLLDYCLEQGIVAPDASAIIIPFYLCKLRKPIPMVVVIGRIGSSGMINSYISGSGISISRIYSKSSQFVVHR